MKIALRCILISLLLPSIAFGGNEILVLNGTPFSQSKINIQKSASQNLTESQQNEYRLLITKNGDEYFWASRENIPLIKNISGDITVFISPRGSGYIRVSKVEGKFLYMEHMPHGFQSVTYWGISDNFKP